jgi:hypothetical protein
VLDAKTISNLCHRDETPTRACAREAVRCVRRTRQLAAQLWPERLRVWLRREQAATIARGHTELGQGRAPECGHTVPGWY